MKKVYWHDGDLHDTNGWYSLVDDELVNSLLNDNTIIERNDIYYRNADGFFPDYGNGCVRGRHGVAFIMLVISGLLSTQLLALAYAAFDGLVMNAHAMNRKIK